MFFSHVGFAFSRNALSVSVNSYDVDAGWRSDGEFVERDKCSLRPVVFKRDSKGWRKRTVCDDGDGLFSKSHSNAKWSCSVDCVQIFSANSKSLGKLTSKDFSEKPGKSLKNVCAAKISMPNLLYKTAIKFKFSIFNGPELRTIPLTLINSSTVSVVRFCVTGDSNFTKS